MKIVVLVGHEDDLVSGDIAGHLVTDDQGVRGLVVIDGYVLHERNNGIRRRFFTSHGTIK